MQTFFDVDSDHAHQRGCHTADAKGDLFISIFPSLQTGIMIILF